MQIERQLQKIEDLEFVELAHRVVKWVQATLNSRQTAFARIEIESSSEWMNLRNREHNESCGEAVLWLEELLGQL